MQILSLMAVFIEYPLLAAGIGVLFMAVGRWARSRAAIGIGLAWVLYAAYETGMRQRWLCSGECNIRIDLFLIYPGLLIGSAIAFFALLRRRHAQAHRL